MQSDKTKVIVVYGGKSAEHEVSCRSAHFVLKNLDPAKFDVTAIGIDKSGHWLPQSTKQLLKSTPEEGLPIFPGEGVPQQAPQNGVDPAMALMALPDSALDQGRSRQRVVVFPVIHGTNGEDGTLQGMLELADVAYVGPDVLGSAIGMDKVVSKKLVAMAGVPVVPWVEVRKHQWAKGASAICEQAVTELGLPLFVKPARQGSSVGVSKVKRAEDLRKAVDEALSFDDKVLIERGLDVREIELAALGSYEPMISVPGEVIPNAEFYSYDAKYLDPNGAQLAVPAKLTPEQAAEAQQLAKQSFVALELFGMARIDLFLEKKSGKFYFNEVNTIPGFTIISQYPMLWKASGVEPGQLVEKLIELAIERQKTKAALRRDYKK